MKTILIKPTEIESCWEKNDACFIRMKSSKVWVCEQIAYKQVKEKKDDGLIEIPLLDKRGGKYDK